MYPSATGTVKFLLDAGADIHAETADGLSVMMLANEAGNKELIRVLIEAGAETPIGIGMVRKKWLALLVGLDAW